VTFNGVSFDEQHEEARNDDEGLEIEEFIAFFITGVHNDQMFTVRSIPEDAKKSPDRCTS
jgi:hypothetical protein